MSFEQENFDEMLLYLRRVADQIPLSTRLKNLLAEAVRKLESKESLSPDEEATLAGLKDLPT
jgi:hypothetical protein